MELGITLILAHRARYNKLHNKNRTKPPNALRSSICMYLTRTYKIQKEKIERINTHENKLSNTVGDHDSSVH